jgi:hypothetical protein
VKLKKKKSRFLPLSDRSRAYGPGPYGPNKYDEGDKEPDV